MTSLRPSRRASDSIEAFWGDWHERREQSKVSGSKIAELVHSNKTTVLERGRPGSKTKVYIARDEVQKLLAAIQIPESEQVAWLERYEQLHNEHFNGSPESTPSGPSWRRYWLTAAAAVVLGAMAAVAATWWLRPAPAMFAAGPVVITVQNMVALGEDGLQEDTTRVYLSTRPERQCSRPEKNCKLPGTEMTSNAQLVATCWLEGNDELVNFNRDSAVVVDNPHRAKSKRWYRVALHDQRTGLISEVYLVERDRGGRGLPQCAS